MGTTKGSKDIFVRLGASSHSDTERQLEDYYATEPRAMEILLMEETFDKQIWECACGQGHLSEVLKKNGYTVLSTDLVDRGYGEGNIDFLLRRDKWNGDIITNPPYKYAKDFIETALNLIEDGHKVAMFLKLTFLESKSRKVFFTKHPFRTLYVFSGRVQCAKNGDFDTYSSGNAVAYGWYVWEKGFKGNPEIKWVN